MGYLSVKNLLNVLDGKPIEGLEIITMDDEGVVYNIPSIDTGTRIVTPDNYKTEIK